MDTKCGANLSNRMLLNAAKFQGHSFYRFPVIKGNTHTPRLGLKIVNTLNKLKNCNKYIKTMNLKYQLQHGKVNLNYVMDHILYQIFKIILDTFSKT